MARLLIVLEADLTAIRNCGQFRTDDGPAFISEAVTLHALRSDICFLAPGVRTAFGNTIKRRLQIVHLPFLDEFMFRDGIDHLSLLLSNDRRQCGPFVIAQ